MTEKQIVKEALIGDYLLNKYLVDERKKSKEIIADAESCLRLTTRLWDTFFGTNIEDEIEKRNNTPYNRCPCCGRQMYKLNDGTWTHLISKAMREAEEQDKNKKQEECCGQTFEEHQMTKWD